MNYLTICLFLIHIGFLSQVVAQSDAMIDQLTDATCECAKSIESGSKSAEEIQMELGLCIVQGLSSDMEKYQDELGVDITDQESMQKIGEKIGFRMATKCPEVLMLMMATQDTKLQTETTTTTTQSNQLVGKVASVEGGEFTYLILNTEDGSTHKLLWFGNIALSTEFEEDPSKLVNKEVTVSFDHTETYSFDKKGYVTRKIIKSLSLQ